MPYYIRMLSGDEVKPEYSATINSKGEGSLSKSYSSDKKTGENSGQDVSYN